MIFTLFYLVFVIQAPRAFIFCPVLSRGKTSFIMHFTLIFITRPAMPNLINLFLCYRRHKPGLSLPSRVGFIHHFKLTSCLSIFRIRIANSSGYLISHEFNHIENLQLTHSYCHGGDCKRLKLTKRKLINQNLFLKKIIAYTGVLYGS